MEKFKYLYGPVWSWRLGRSLGVDLLAGNKKICTFDCLYCQLGGTPTKTRKRKIFASTPEVIKEIKNIRPGLPLDYITFSGMGEPTLAKNLGEVIREIKSFRGENIAVLTDSSLMWDKPVRDELALADFVMAKLDASDENSFRRVNRPAPGITFEDVYQGIKQFRREHDSRLGLQVMFFEANKDVFKKLAELAFGIKPDEVEVNTPLRPCEVKPLSKEDIAVIAAYFRKYGKQVNSKARVISVYEADRKNVREISEEDTRRRRNMV